MVKKGWDNAKMCPNVFRAFLHTFAKVALDTDASDVIPL